LAGFSAELGPGELSPAPHAAGQSLDLEAHDESFSFRQSILPSPCSPPPAELTRTRQTVQESSLFQSSPASTEQSSARNRIIRSSRRQPPHYTRRLLKALQIASRNTKAGQLCHRTISVSKIALPIDSAAPRKSPPTPPPEGSPRFLAPLKTP